MPGSQKHWFYGLPFSELDASGDQKYWLDGLPQPGIEAAGPATITRSHTTDALLRATLTTSHTTDALLEAVRTAAHTTDALLWAVLTRAHTTDALLRAALTASHTTDALLEAIGSVAHTTDALLEAVNTLTHTTDALLRATLTQAHTTDALLKATTTAAHTTDALLRATLTHAHTTDALLEGALTASHTTDALLEGAVEASHTTDALLWAERTISHTTDALLAVRIIHPPPRKRRFVWLAHRLESERRRSWATGDRVLIAPPPIPDLPEFAAFQFTDRFQYNIVRARAERRVSFSEGGWFTPIIPPDLPEFSGTVFRDAYPYRALLERLAADRRLSWVYDDSKTAPFLNFPDSAALQHKDAYPYRALARASEAVRRISAYFDPNALYDWSWVEPAFYRDRFDYRRVRQLLAFLRTQIGSQVVIGIPIAPPPGAPTVIGRVIEFCSEDRTLDVLAETRPEVSFENREVYAMPTAEVACEEFVKDPQAVKDYTINWRNPDRPLLETGETIATSSWTGGGLTVVSSKWSGDRATVFLSGGAAGSTYLPKNTITTTVSGRTYNRELKLVIRYT